MVSGLQSSRLPSSRLTFLSICNNMKVYITKIYIIIRKYSIKFFNHFTRNKPLKNKFLMLANKNRQLCHTFFGSCIIKAIFYHERLFTHFSSHILIMNRSKYKRTSINYFTTHFLTLIAFRNKINYRRISTNSFIAFFVSLKAIRNKF